jgi:hypothetical protein
MTTSEIEDFAAGVLRKNHNDVMRSLQYLEHCIQSCNNSSNHQRRDEFAEVRDYIEQNHMR